MTKYYYTIEEALKPDYFRSFQVITHTGTKQPNFKDVVDTFYSEVPTWAKETGADYNYLNKAFEMVRARFKKEDIYFAVLDEEYDLTTHEGCVKMHQAVQMRAENFIETMYATKDKYIALIKAQEALKDDILKDVSNSTETWFNDTPQVKGDYTDLDYASNYTRTKNNLSLGPVSLKLEEVDKAMDDIYERWAREFDKFIIVY